MMFVEKGVHYRATIKFSWLESATSNNTIFRKFADVGFTEIFVTGSGKDRIATGLWPLESVEVELPKQVTGVTKMPDI